MFANDSLKGRRRLTKELAKKLLVFGVLIMVGPSKTPVLRTQELDTVAGFLSASSRSRNPIQVAGRQRIQKIRTFLCRQLVAWAEIWKEKSAEAHIEEAGTRAR